MCGLMSDLVICKFRKNMVIHDTEYPYRDQVSLNNTNQTVSGWQHHGAASWKWLMMKLFTLELSLVSSVGFNTV